jgi:uracil-DNA glycosylase
MTKIALVGEAWGEAEERERVPFIGAAGFELNRMLDEAGIRRADCFLTNVFNLRPRPTNDISNLCVPKAQDRSGLPPLSSGKYIAAEFLGELARLHAELRSVQPNIVVAFGGTASWALLHNGAISKIRGGIATSVSPPGLKVLPTYHPAAVLRGGSRSTRIFGCRSGRSTSSPHWKIWSGFMRDICDPPPSYLLTLKPDRIKLLVSGLRPPWISQLSSRSWIIARVEVTGPTHNQSLGHGTLYGGYSLRQYQNYFKMVYMICTSFGDATASPR